MTRARAADLVARMNGFAATPPPAAAVAPSAPTPGDAGRRSGGGRRRRGAGGAAVRYTVDLEAGLHRSLHLWAIDHRTDASEVVRALIELLAEDQVLGQQVADRLEAGGS